MGGFIIQDTDGEEIVRARKYYGAGLMNNEAKISVLWDAFNCLINLFTVIYHYNFLCMYLRTIN